jgi:hypothetical protein
VRPYVHYQSEEVPVVLMHRNDLVVTVQITSESTEVLDIVLTRRDAADLRNMLDIWLEGPSQEA